MSERKHILYFLGSLNGDIHLFKQIWVFIKEYLSEGNASLFVAGNFGLGNPDFIKMVAKEISGLVQIHVAGGNAAKEGWERIPPPVKSVKEIAPGIFLHAFGSTVTLGTKRILFLGRGEAFSEDYLPLLNHQSYCVKPHIRECMTAISKIERQNPDIIVSHAMPTDIASIFLSKFEKNDVRRKRLTDEILPSIDRIQKVYKCQAKKERYWFAGSLGTRGMHTSDNQITYISLCPFIMVRGSLASLEYIETQKPTGITYALKNLAYV